MVQLTCCKQGCYHKQMKHDKMKQNIENIFMATYQNIRCQQGMPTGYFNTQKLVIIYK